MPMQYNEEKGIYEFGYSYINDYVKNHIEGSHWNETQLYLMVETFVNAIDTITESFMSRGYIGSAVWLFKQLLLINDYAKSKGQYFFDDEDVDLKKLEKPLLKYRWFMLKARVRPSGWLSEVDNVLTKPHQLVVGEFYELFRLQSLQRCSAYYNKAQRQEAHAIFSELLTDAIATLKHSEAYKKAKQENQLYFDLAAHIPAIKREELPFDHSNAKHATKDHASFFQPSTDADQSTSTQSRADPPTGSKRKLKHYLSQD